ncbi:MAG: hypothetical protein Unbinned5406contig1000_14 [Prokaryotic dsDNA virus sp.]|jgi:hypothetical protein|nr:MAG: hypothetical protein Unbinned5406contig1000_14 [Prokaryotic dsDNA virus sp.]|tara:strand:- start:38989 stop:39423 length:435 start_codon:yes stop_codon:yes gene_type:complete
MKKKTKAEKVWAYLLKHPTAKTKNVAKACGCTAKYVYTLRSKVGTPTEVLVQSTDKTDKERTRVKLLSEAIALVDGDREEEHGDFADNAMIIAELWSAYKDVDFTPHDVPMMMALLKIARAKSNPANEDNYRDGCGYLALASEV